MAAQSVDETQGDDDRSDTNVLVAEEEILDRDSVIEDRWSILERIVNRAFGRQIYRVCDERLKRKDVVSKAMLYPDVHS